MFEDIAQLENEIEEFRKNIVASSELLNSITNLAEEIKQQKDSFPEELQRQAETINNGFVQQLKSGNVDKIHKNVQRLEPAIQKSHDDLQRLGSAGIDKIITEVHNLKKSIRTKFTIIMAGIGITVVAIILSLAIK